MMGALSDEGPASGRNSRHFDIERTAQEISQAQAWRAEFYRIHAGPKATKRQRIETFALIDTDLTAEEFRLLCLRLRFCNDNCDNYRVSREREAALLGKSVSAIERASKGLECADGLENYQRSQRRTNRPSHRMFDVPRGKGETAKELLAVCEAANVRVLETAEMRFEGSETADLQSRNRRSEGLTLLRNSKEKECAQPGDCAPVRKPAFDEFWVCYPNKAGKAKARQLYGKLSVEDCIAAINGIGRYKRSEKFKKGYVQQGDTYLSKRTWEDEALLQQASGGSPTKNGRGLPERVKAAEDARKAEWEARGS